MQAAIGLVGSGMSEYALAIGMDTAQGRPGDAVNTTVGAGGAAFVLGPAQQALAVIQRSSSYVSDTTDFWRRPGTHYPSHAERFSGDPGYFAHVISAAQEMMDAMATTPADYDFAVLHQPNPKFPTRALRELGFRKEQWQTGLLVPEIGNTYAGSAIIGLTAVLGRGATGSAHSHGELWQRRGGRCVRPPGDRPYFRRGRACADDALADIARRVEIDYAEYVRLRRKLATH